MVEMPSKLRVLVVEDDEDTRFLLGQHLRLAGYESVAAPSAEHAYTRLSSEPIDVVIADIGIPGETGLDLLRWVRQQQLPCEVIILTGNPSVNTAIQALRDGAVDYLTKPVANAVLVEALERIETRLRVARQRQEALTMLEAGLRHFTGQRSNLPPTAPLNRGAATDKLYHIGPVVLDLDRFVIEVNGQGIEATPSEIEILHYLCRNPGRVITAQEMVQSIRGYRVEPHQAPEIIRPHISNLRRKLIAAEAEADVVRTVRGVGYMLKVPVTKG